MEDFIKYTQKMCTVHGVETMLKITNTIVKILQEIITEPENLKFKSVRIAAQVSSYILYIQSTPLNRVTNQLTENIVSQTVILSYKSCEILTRLSDETD